MAQDIVSGLFGLTPFDVQQQQNAQIAQQANSYAQMNPLQRATAGMYQAGAQLARPVAGMMGMVNPVEQQAAERQAALSGLDISSPEAILAQAQKIQDPQLKMRLMLIADQQKKEQQKQLLAVRKQDFQENEAFEFKKQQLAQQLQIAQMQAENQKLSIQQRADAAKEANAIKAMMAQLVYQARMAGVEQKKDATTAKTSAEQDKEKKNALAFLKEAGFDPETGKDEVTELIKKSTSGRMEALGSETAAFFGATTEGRKAINTLNATANRIVMALMGGKLGSGISNADREFIVGQLGDVGNPNKTSDERLAAWNSAKSRMIDIGMVDVKKPDENQSEVWTRDANGKLVRSK